jgi:hypothetical protein
VAACSQGDRLATGSGQLACRGSGGFEEARDALTLSLSSADLDTETKEGFCSVL